jgi:hypothetical protein
MPKKKITLPASSAAEERSRVDQGKHVREVYPAVKSGPSRVQWLWKGYNEMGYPDRSTLNFELGMYA